MIKKELQIFLTAVMFYTRIPCPKWVDHNPHYINLCTRYFPLIGWMVGGIYAIVIVLLTLVSPPFISILLGMVVSILLTGAFHEDGLADVCDGFGGGWTKEKILMIMKDSRVGAYGVIGLILVICLKFSGTYDLLISSNTTNFILLIISSHSLSRMMAVIIIYFQTYARDDQDSKAKPVANGINTANLCMALLFGLAPFFVLIFETKILLSLVILPMLLITLYLMYYFKKWIGGYTGDCLGATQQVNEIVFLLATLMLWRFM